jgi:hypothetical protein
MYDGAGFARHLFDIRTMALLRVLMDQGIYVGISAALAQTRTLQWLRAAPAVGLTGPREATISEPDNPRLQIRRFLAWPREVTGRLS